jgi:hypothetical protein
MATSKARAARRAAVASGDYSKQYNNAARRIGAQTKQQFDVEIDAALQRSKARMQLPTSYDPELIGTLNEPVLDDDYSVYGCYMYVVDGRVTCSDVFGSVRTLKRCELQKGLSADEVRRCDIYGRADRDLLQGFKV